MLSGLIDYLLGESEQESKAKPQISSLEVSETTEGDFILITDTKKTLDDDWVYVNQAERDDSGEEDASEIDNDDDDDGDWVVAPPQCFRQNDSRSSATFRLNEMENLLIEHPSMSVYVRTRTRGSVSRRRAGRRNRPHMAHTTTMTVRREMVVVKESNQAQAQATERRDGRACLTVAAAARALGVVPTLSSRKTAPTRHLSKNRNQRGALRMANMTHHRWSGAGQRKYVKKIVCPRKNN